MPIIKAGAYRFNDKVNMINNTIRLPFIVKQPFIKDEETRTIRAANEPTIHYFTSIHTSTYQVAFGKADGMYLYYDTTSGWDFTYNSLISNGYSDEGKLSSRLGQNIFVTADTEVDDTEATWFENNTDIQKKFTKLNLGDVIATSGARCFKRLSTVANGELQ